MPLKTSFYNKTLFKKNLTRFWPLWAGIALFGSIIPLYMFLELISGNQTLRTFDVTFALYTVVSEIVPFFLLFYCSLVGVLIWSYLNTAKSVGLYHTLPISRGGLFVTTTLSGIAMVVLPFAIVGGLFVLVSGLFGALSAHAVLWTVLMVLGMTLYFLGAATFSAQIAGNSFSMLGFYYLLNFLAVLLDWLISSFANGFYFGVNTYYTGNFDAFSPLVKIYRILGHEAVYLNEQRVDYILTGRYIVGIYALVGIALFALSYFLYKRRHSETAGDVVAQDFVKPIFQYGIALLSGLTLGQVLYELLYALPFGSGQKELVPVAICFTIMALLGYYVAAMLLKKSLRVFHGDRIGPILTVVLSIVFCTGVAMDFFGTQSYIPAAEDVKEVYISGLGNSLSFDGESPLYDRLTALQADLIANKDFHIAEETNRDGSSVEGEYERRWVDINYYLKDGRHYSYEYRLYFDVEDFKDPNSHEAKFADLLASDEAIALRLQPYDATGEMMTAYYYGGGENGYEILNGYEFTGEERQQLIDALRTDIKNKEASQIILGISSTEQYIGYLELLYPTSTGTGHASMENSSDSMRYSVAGLDVTDAMTETMALLYELAAKVENS